MKIPTIKELTNNMVEVGLLTREQLKKAVEEQRESGGNLGEILISEGYITEDVFMAFLGKKSDLSYVDLKSFGDIEPEVLKLVPENFSRKRELIPVKKTNNTLVVAIADPMNIFAIDDLRAITGKNIEIVLAVRNEIKKAIDRYYGTGFVDEFEKEIGMNGGTENDDSTSNVDAGAAFSSIMKEISVTKPGDAELQVMESGNEAGAQDITNIKKESEGAPVVKMVNLIILNAISKGASDIHVEPFDKSCRIRYRVDGVLHPQPAPPKKVYNAIVARLKVMANVDLAEKRLPQDGRIKVKLGKKEIDLRISFLPSSFGEKVVMRVLDSSSLCLDLKQLGFEQRDLARFKKIINTPNGIVLVTGPTGSGKTTTLYSALTNLNRPDVNINTIEDPVEYVLKGIIQVQAKPDIGFDFASGLETFLRQDPDIIMVGEIRNKETAEIAINAALTGHLVFSTLHTNDAPTAVTRLDNMGIEPFLISSTVIMAIAQRLVRTICKNCRESYEVDTGVLENYGLTPDEIGDKDKVTLYKGRGCQTCSDTGYKGRLAIYELMEVTNEVRELINKKAAAYKIKETAVKQGMNTLRLAAFNKVLKGDTTIDEMIRVTASDTG